MHWTRLGFVAAILAVALWAGWQLRTRGPAAVPFLKGCQFRRITGLQCPGCGMTRATHAALNGRFGEAFTLNPLGMVLLPIALIGLVPETLNWVSRRPVAWRLRPGVYGSGLIVICVMAFWIWRNIAWPT